MSAITISGDYGYVIAVVGIAGLQQFFTGFGVIPYRTKHFKNNKALWAKPAVKAMSDEYKKATGNDISTDGLPDMGNGPLSQHLEYSQWADINNAQRVHYKMVEESAPMLACMLGAGLVYPKTVAILGLVNCVGRYFWGLGYMKGPGKRYSFGVPIFGSLAYLGVLGMGVYAGLEKAGAIKQIVGLFAGK